MGVMEREAPAVEPVGEAVPFTSRLHDWVVTVDHKRLGIMYIIAGLVLLRRRRHDGDAHAAAARRAEQHTSCRRRCSTVCSPCTARRWSSWSRMPILFGFGNYLVPLMIGRARPRLSAPQRVRLLALPVRRPAALLQLHRGRRAVRRRLGARRRLVRLRAADRAGLLARQQHRLLDPRHPRERHRHAPRPPSTSSPRRCPCAARA